MELTEVPPDTMPTLNVVLGSSGVLSFAISPMARPIAWMGFAMPNAPKL
jgi:hypothetical protein